MKPVSQGDLIDMRDTMFHRGPDESGIYCNAGLGLGFRRLKTFDLSPTGYQPMSNENDDIYIVFDGAFYNYEEYKADLVSKGHYFKSSTDVEGVLHLYEEYGIDETLRRMNGMFAFCLWVKRNETIYLVRDRFGIKPLYFANLKDGISRNVSMKMRHLH